MTTIPCFILTGGTVLQLTARDSVFSVFSEKVAGAPGELYYVRHAARAANGVHGKARNEKDRRCYLPTGSCLPARHWPRKQLPARQGPAAQGVPSVLLMHIDCSGHSGGGSPH